MRLKTFNRNLLIPALSVGLAALAPKAFAAAGPGIPTMDVGVGLSLDQGFMMNGENIRTQTEAIVNAIDYSAKAVSKVIVDTETNSLKTEKALETKKEFTPEVSKPSGACTTFEAAGGRGASWQPSAGISRAMAKLSHGKNLRAAELVTGVPRAERAHTEVIKRLEDPEATKTVTIFEPLPFTEAEYGDVMDTILYASNPIPQPVYSQAELSVIGDHGSPENKSSYARVLVHTDRLKRMQQVLMNQKDNDLQIYDSKPFEFLYNKKNLSPQHKELLAGKLSKNQMDKLFATYRVESKEWVSRIHNGSSRRVLNDQALMQAEMLRLLWSINTSLDTLVNITAQSEANRLNQAGATEF